MNFECRCQMLANMEMENSVPSISFECGCSGSPPGDNAASQGLRGSFGDPAGMEKGDTI